MIPSEMIVTYRTLAFVVPLQFPYLSPLVFGIIPNGIVILNRFIICALASWLADSARARGARGADTRGTASPSRA